MERHIKQRHNKILFIVVLLLSPTFFVSASSRDIWIKFINKPPSGQINYITGSAPSGGSLTCGIDSTDQWWCDRYFAGDYYDYTAATINTATWYKTTVYNNPSGTWGMTINESPMVEFSAPAGADESSLSFITCVTDTDWECQFTDPAAEGESAATTTGATTTEAILVNGFLGQIFGLAIIIFLLMIFVAGWLYNNLIKPAHGR